MNGHKPIQTRYKGYHFRSRLEARYAVFFDALTALWLYEPEGYLVTGLSGETKYLPDFYLPQFNYWIEIKGAPPSIWAETDEEAKMLSLCKRTQRAGAILYSLPGSETPAVNTCWVSPTPYEILRIVSGESVQRPPSGIPEVLNPLTRRGEVVYMERRIGIEWFTFTAVSPDFLSSACEAARCARFEHGESGYVNA